MAVAVTEDVLVRDTVSIPTANAATADTNNLAEEFTITPTQGVEKMLIIIDIANTHGTVVAKLMKGTYWAKKDLSWDCAQNVCSVISVNDIARFMNASGNIVVELTPATDKKLTSEHAATMRVIELPQ